MKRAKESRFPLTLIALYVAFLSSVASFSPLRRFLCLHIRPYSSLAHSKTDMHACMPKGREVLF